MIQFLQPAAFVALLGLLVPLLIHLWERREGKRVLFGSIRWLEESEAPRVSHLRFSDLVRFILRCIILILFTILLAEAAWQTRQEPPADNHWLLVEEAGLQNDALRTIVDSLQREENLPVRLLRKGFPAWSPEISFVRPDSLSNYWHLLSVLSERSDRPDTVTLLAHPQLRHFSGKRPALPFVVRWQSLPEEAPSSFIAAAWHQESQIQLLIGKSHAGGTTFTRAAIPAEAGRHQWAAGEPEVRLRRGSAPEDWQAALAVAADPGIAVEPFPARTIWIVYDLEHLNDQRQLRAALRAVAGYTSLGVDAKWWPAGEAPALIDQAVDSTHWLVWLSSEVLPDRLAQKFSPRLVRPGEAVGNASPYFIRKPAYFELSRPLAGDGPRIDAGLPTALVDLLFTKWNSIAAGADQRSISPSQLKPAYQPNPRQSNRKAATRQPLHLPIWLLLLGLFLIERQWKEQKISKQR